ncbi:hypothetical protein MP638_000276 [Amoeboaphelidium occidentale]|nr:hypothetical protein MP638_000276 [Amoeboaphelidium occidentale]
MLSRKLFSVPSVALRGSRFFAAEAASAPKSDKLTLNLATPYQTIFQTVEVERVDIPSTAGDMGILVNHVPTLHQLRPGVVDVVAVDGSKSKKLFVSGGFAVMNPDNSLNINVLEAVTPDQIDKNAIRSAMAEAQKVADSGKDEQEKLLASAQLEVYQALEKL